MRWISSSSRFPVDSNSQAYSTLSQDTLTTSLQNMMMEDATTNLNSSIVEPFDNEKRARASSSQLATSHLESSNGDDAGLS